MCLDKDVGKNPTFLVASVHPESAKKSRHTPHSSRNSQGPLPKGHGEGEPLEQQELHGQEGGGQRREGPVGVPRKRQGEWSSSQGPLAL